MKRSFLSIAVAIFLLLSSNQGFALEGKSIATNSCQKITDVKASKSIDNLVGNYGNEIKIIFSDLDGTIVPIESVGIQPMPTPSEIKAYNNLKNSGVKLVVATGRISREAKEVAGGLVGRDETYFILEQGALIEDSSGKIICKDFISGKDAKAIVKEFLSFKKAHNFKDSNYYVMANGKRYSTTPFTMAYNGEKVPAVKSLDVFGKDFSTGKVEIVEPDIEKCKLIQAHLKKKFPNFRIDISGSCFCCVTSPTATKGNAVKKMAEMLGYDLKNVAVLGDAENDISMLKLVRESGGLAIALGNGFDSVKENANYVTSPVTQDGWSIAINKIIENNKLLSKNNKCCASQKK